MPRNVRRASMALGQTLTVVGAAISAAAAVRSHRRPSDDTLRALGIEPATFPPPLG